MYYKTEGLTSHKNSTIGHDGKIRTIAMTEALTISIRSAPHNKRMQKDILLATRANAADARRYKYLRLCLGPVIICTTIDYTG